MAVSDAPQFLALPNVLCYGGAWVASPELVRARDWQTITANSRLAAAQKKA